MSSKKILLLVGLVAIVAAVAAQWLMSRGSQATPAPSPIVAASPAPSPDALVETDRILLTRLSSELAVKYRSFERVDQAYLNSIRPYLTKQFFDDYRSTLRYADRAPFLQPVRSSAEGTDVTGDSSRGRAVATVRLRSTNIKSGDRFNQTLQIHWQRFGNRWSATKVNALELGGTNG